MNWAWPRKPTEGRAQAPEEVWIVMVGKGDDEMNSVVDVRADYDGAKGLSDTLQLQRTSPAVDYYVLGPWKVAR